jgi:hypothetical protein
MSAPFCYDAGIIAMLAMALWFTPPMGMLLRQP